MLQLIYSTVEVAIFSVAILTAAGIIGGIIMSMIGLSDDDFSFSICAGLLPLVIPLYYFRNIREGGVAIGICVGSYALLAAGGVWLRLKNQGQVAGLGLGQVAGTCLFFSAWNIIFAGSGGPATYGNNDIYNWYAVASTLLGRANYLQMSPSAGDYWGSFLDDGTGTSWMLALVAAFSEDPIQTVTLFYVVAASWLSLIYQWQIRRLFDFGPYAAFAFSLLPLTAALYIYISFNGFFAQLLGTAGCALAISSVIKWAAGEVEQFFKRVFLLLIPVLWGLYVYQSGFVILSLIAYGFAFFYSFLGGGSLDQRIRRFYGFFGALTMSFFIAALLSPSLVAHLIERTKVVSGVAAGWALPRFPIDVFSGFSFASGAAWLFNGTSAEDGWIEYFLVLTVAVAVLAGFCGRLKSMSKGGAIIFSFSAWYVFLIGVYFIWHLSGVSRYQNWKFASFFVFSAASVPIGLLWACVQTAVSHISRHAGFSQSRFFGVIAVALSAISISNSSYMASKATKIGPQIRQLVGVRNALPPKAALVLDLPAYGSSMLPMLILSRRASIYPVSNTYIPAADEFPVGDDVFVLSSSQCPPLIEGSLPSDGLKPVHQDKDYLLLKGRYSHAATYRFSGGGSWCGISGDVILKSGFYDGEDWGRWAGGDSSELSVRVPSRLVNKNLVLYFKIHPYLPANILSQRLTVRINGKNFGDESIRGPRTLSYFIPASIVESGRLDIALSTPDAVSPSQADPPSGDARRLAIGAISLTVAESEVKKTNEK